MGLGGVLGQTNNGTTGIVAPVRSKQTGESGDEDDTGVVFDFASLFTDFASRVNEGNVVTEPLDGRAGDSNGAFEGISRGWP